ncbi:MAG: PspC domain-containing protein [Spirochaetales bacterium]|nr:PspC domain-containing protein [Spirochaetales bacterium]
MTYTSRRLYRSRNGMLLGICQGIADWRDLPVFVVRLIFVIICLATAVAPCVIIYLLMGLIIPIEPRSGYKRDENYYENFKRNGKATMDDIKSEFDNLKSRVNKMEDEATKDKESDWDQRFHSGG